MAEEVNLKKEEDNNINKDIKEINDEEGNESFKKENNNKNKYSNINLNEYNNKDEIVEKKIEEKDNNNKENNNDNDNNENINKKEEQNNNNQKGKKNKKRKIKNKTKYLRIARQKQRQEKNGSKNLDIENDIIKLSNNKKNDINKEEKSLEENIINNNDESSKENDNIIETIEISNIRELQNNLKPKEKLGDYFKRMLKYYKINKNKDYYYLYDLANNDYYSVKNKFKFKINYDLFPFISNMFKFLKNQLEPVKDTNNKEVYKEYQGPESFGYLIHDKYEYFYVFKNEFNRELFNDINNVKQYEYDNAFNVFNSRYSNITGNENLDKIDSHFLSSEDFENKINKYFMKFNLKQLPNYFFRLSKKNKKEIPFNKDYNYHETDMNCVDRYSCPSYIEIDGAFEYLNPKQLIIINENDKLFKCSKTISISSWGDEIKIKDDKLDLIIEPNSIILIEDKLSFPKVIRNLTNNKKIKKDDLFTSLNFFIYKIIKKISIFNEYLVSTSEGTTRIYSYYLLLIYDSNPILNVENIIINIIKDLKKENLIKYPKFQIKAIYVLPCITLNESKEVDELKTKIKNLKEEIEIMKRTIKQ